MIRRSARSIALFGAVLVLAAQFLSLSHFHQGNSTRQFNPQRLVAAEDGLCALCILAFHTPLNPAPVLAIEHPDVEIQRTDIAIARLHVADSFSSYRTRAPPLA